MNVVTLRRAATHESKAEASVILRRQVPIRFEETARSWLGGLPQMPRTIPWPRAATNGAALNFIAQICCADLPKRLWGGRGPREGWLLLFAEYQQLYDSEDDTSLVQVLHINRLGPERHPPGKTVLRSILGRLTSSDDNDGEEANKPALVFRRWPLDIVTQEAPLPPPIPENALEWEWAPLPITAENLYGARVDAEPIGQLAKDEPRPRTWRAARHMIDELAKHFAVHEFPRSKKNEDGSYTRLEPERLCSALNDVPKQIPPDWKPGWLEDAKARAAATLAEEVARAEKLEAWLDEHSSERGTKFYALQREHLARARAWLPHGERVIAGLAPYSGVDGEMAIAEEVAIDFRQHTEWVEKMRAMLADMSAHVRKHRIDSDIPEGEWRALKAKMMAEKTEYWTSWNSISAMWRNERSLFDYGKRYIDDQPRDSLLDTYARSAAAQSAIGPELIAALEPKLRHIDPAPHRMGGPCDPIQGFATPAQGDLLFQIASDEAMGWMWADLGALFVYIDPADLKAGRFAAINTALQGG